MPTPPELGGGAVTIVSRSIRAGERHALVHRVILHIGFGDQAAVRRHVLGQKARRLAFVEVLRAQLLHALQGACQWGSPAVRRLRRTFRPSEKCDSIPRIRSGRALCSDCASAYDTGKPFAASSIAGCTRSAHGLVPYLWLAYSSRAPCRGRRPRGIRSRILRRLAGRVEVHVARGRLRRMFAEIDDVLRPSARRISMKPPPPMLPALGWVTASASPTAAAASMALPPFFKTCNPVSVACRSRETTIPCRARTGCAAHIGTQPRSAAELRVTHTLDSTMRRSVGPASWPALIRASAARTRSPSPIVVSWPVYPSCVVSSLYSSLPRPF